jgi:hypothetical protein
LECTFGVVGKILMSGSNGIYLVRFGFRTWEILIFFLVISAAENSNKFYKIRFWKEKSIENVVPLGLTAQATLANERPSHSLKNPLNPTPLFPYGKFRVQSTKTVKIATNV